MIYLDMTVVYMNIALGSVGFGRPALRFAGHGAAAALNERSKAPSMFGAAFTTPAAA
jgi:hypothetical protein